MKCSIFPRYKWLGNELLSVSISRVGIIKQLSNFYLGLLYSIVRILYPKENLLRHSSLSSAFSSLWSFLIILLLTPSIHCSLLVKDPRAPRTYLFSDVQNMYNKVVLVCSVNVYTSDSLGRGPILWYQVLQVT